MNKFDFIAQFLLFITTTVVNFLCLICLVMSYQS